MEKGKKMGNQGKAIQKTGELYGMSREVCRIVGHVKGDSMFWIGEGREIRTSSSHLPHLLDQSNQLKSVLEETMKLVMRMWRHIFS